MRLALSDGSGGEGAAVVLDPAARMPGRGAYVCRVDGESRPSARCLALAVRRGGIARALRCRAQLNPQDFVESVSQ